MDLEIDTLVLGCTHYPLLRGVIERVAGELTQRHVEVVDSAMATARAALSLRPDASDDTKGALFRHRYVTTGRARATWA
jgi:glutamate racemase